MKTPVREQVELVTQAISEVCTKLGAEHNLEPLVLLAALDIVHHILLTTLTRQGIAMAFAKKNKDN